MTRRWRILQVNKFYAPFVGGVERVVQDIAEGLREDFDMQVLCCHPGGETSRENWNGVEVIRAGTSRTLFSMPISGEFSSLYRELAAEADLIQFHHPFPLADVAALRQGMFGKPVVVWYHSDVVRQWWAMPVYGPILKKFLGRADRILASSKRLCEGSRYLRRFPEKCEVIPFGFRSPNLADAREIALPQEDFVLFAGRLVPYKGAKYLLQAMKSVSAPLVMVGDGPLRAELEALAKKEGMSSRVHFLGALPSGELQTCFARCRLFVLPSVMRSEAFGLVQLEALAHGKPVINTDLPTGVPEVSVHGQTGLTVPPRDVEGLAAAIRNILSDPKQYEVFSQNARVRAASFSMDRFRSGVRGVYLELLRRTARRGGA